MADDVEASDPSSQINIQHFCHLYIRENRKFEFLTKYFLGISHSVLFVFLLDLDGLGHLTPALLLGQRARLPVSRTLVLSVVTGVDGNHHALLAWLAGRLSLTHALSLTLVRTRTRSWVAVAGSRRCLR